MLFNLALEIKTLWLLIENASLVSLLSLNQLTNSIIWQIREVGHVLTNLVEAITHSVLASLCGL